MVVGAVGRGVLRSGVPVGVSVVVMVIVEVGEMVALMTVVLVNASVEVSVRVMVGETGSVPPTWWRGMVMVVVWLVALSATLPSWGVPGCSTTKPP